ncbi:MAG TPA: metallophosphoesterase [Thermoplasmatales archaeon]|nr:metallophosphoesterase [Thermoplasmatales archaeon]
MKTVIKPIQNEAALLIPSKSLLVIADLHIGIEYSLYQQGIHIGSRVDLLIKRVKNMINKHMVKEILILGDVKHVVPSSPHSQKTDLHRFFKEFKDLRLHVIPGNHDGGINRFIPKEVEIHSSKGWVLDDESIGFVHGHRWPSEKVMRCSTIVAAHTHPSVMLKDKMGYRFFEQCWVNTKTDAEKTMIRYSSTSKSDLIIMPAFNPLCGGVAVNVDGVLGPLGKIIDVNSSKVYLLDGSYIGRVKSLKLHI